MAYDVVEVMKHCIGPQRCATCPIDSNLRAEGCLSDLMRNAIRELNELRQPIIPIYDQEEIYHNCTVQVLFSSETGDSSVGWWKEGQCESV